MQTHYPNLTRESKLPSLLFQLCFEKNLAQWVSDRRFLLRIMSVYFCTPKKNVIGRRLCDFSSHLNTNGFYCGSYWFIWLHYFSYADKHKHMSVPGRGLPTLWLLVVWYAGGSRSLFLYPPCIFLRHLSLDSYDWKLQGDDCPSLCFPPHKDITDSQVHMVMESAIPGQPFTQSPRETQTIADCSMRVKYLLDLVQAFSAFPCIIIYVLSKSLICLHKLV